MSNRVAFGAQRRGLLKHNPVVKSAVFLGALLICGSVNLSEAQAWESLRCGNKIVDVGDPLYRVTTLCGEPDQIDQSVEFHTVRELVRTECHPENGRQVCHEIYRERSVEVPIHRLTYDFGRNQFVHFLRFEFGRLVNVETGDRGVK
jgi:hypothetical protein